MSVICVFICTTALVFSTLLVPARAQNFDFSMKLQPPNVIMTLTTTNPQAWVGVGWNNQGRMFPSDAIVCRATDTPACTDRYCTSGNECAIDPNQDIEFTSTVTNGSAQFVVTRLMNTNDPTDHVVVSGDQAMIWATAPGPTSLIHPSGSYSSITVSFDASGNSTVSEPETHFLYWVAIAVFVLLVILGGLVSFFNIAFLRHSRIGPGLKHNIVGLDTIAELSLGDILFIIIYVGAVIIGTLGYHFASHNGFTDSLGFTMAILMGMMIFPVTRLSIISWILGISYERTVKYHRWMGRVLWVATTIHFIIMQRSFPRSFIFSTQGSAGGTIWGFIAWVFLTLLIITSVEPVRRRFHSLFLVSHFLFLIPTLVFSCLHYPNTFVLVVISGGLYVFDWLHRIYCLLNKPSVEITALGSSHTKVLIRPRKNFSWGPGQYIFVQIGCEVDPHPFTITNAPQGADSNLKNNGNEIVLIVKNMGPGTATSRLNKASSTSIRIMGPYGSLSVPPEKYKTIYLCAGGIGITPMASILDFLITDKNRYKNVQHVVFIWAVREMILVEQYSDLFTRAAGSQTFKFKLGVFLTSASQPIEMPYGVISAGRPNCREILQSTPPDKNEAAAMYICGPDPFVVAAIDDGRDLPYKVHIHTETFNL